MKTSVRELRASLKRILEIVQQGEEVLVCSHDVPVAKIVPLVQPGKNDVGFGMWKDREDLENVENFSRNLRKGRRHAI